MTPILSVVMPVYNEATLVRDVVDAWVRELDSLSVGYELALYDDGSRDETPQIVDRLAAEHRSVTVRHHANRGHGPTILRGYHEARGQWVFQTDSDGEMEVSGFRELWNRRDGYDVLIGTRTERASPWPRRIITGVSRLSVRLLFGRGVHDVNSPFRLMRTDRLRELLRDVPDDTFAPNVILSGLAVRRGLRVFETPVRCLQRRAGATSLGGLKAFRMAARSLAQTAGVAFRARRT